MNNIIFKKIDLNTLNKEYNNVDMHCHTSYSDGSSTPEKIIRCAKKLGIGISICDHNQIGGAKIGWRDKNVFCVPGIEVTSCNAKDILLYFYSYKDLEEYFNSYVKGKWKNNIGMNLNKTTLAENEIIDFGKAYNCVIILPHPFAKAPKNSYCLFNQDKKLFKQIDGIEAINSSIEAWRNNLAMKWSSKIRRSFTAGSDMHYITELGGSLTIGNERKVEGFLEEIRKRKNKVMGCSLTGFNMFVSQARIFANNFRLRA